MTPVRECRLGDRLVRSWPLLALLIGPTASAATLAELCPNANQVIASAPFPVSAPPSLSAGTVTVDFTVGADGSTGSPTIVSSSDVSLEDGALAVVGALHCIPQPGDASSRLPISFMRPEALRDALCPDFRRVMGNIRFPREAARRGIEAGEVIVDFVIKSSGAIDAFEFGA